MALERWSVLALLRFFLASIVAVNHLAEYTALGMFAFIPKLGAFEAILGFLLISGYSVTVSYLHSPEHFLRRRLFRLYPVYAASVLLTAGVSVYLSEQELPSLGYLAANLLFLNQLVTQTSFVGPAWSLSLEFWLYCLLPLIVGLKPLNARLLVYLSFAAYVVYTAMRSLLHLPYYSGVGFGLNLVLLAFIWICGLRLAQSNVSQKAVLLDIRLLFWGHMVIAMLIQFGHRVKQNAAWQFLNDDVPDYFLECVTLFLVYQGFRYVLSDAAKNNPPSRSMRTLGDISYPLYLVHIPVFVVAAKLGITSPILFFGAAMLFSYLIYAVFDVYSKRRDRPRTNRPMGALGS